MGSLAERGDATWLRVADVARLLGVSANTVRRWTDAGRLVAFRSPGGHRRYLAADVHALLPNGGAEGAALPGDFADLRRRAEDLHAVVLASTELTALLAEVPRDVPELAARRLCQLSGAPRCDILVRDGDRLRLTVSVSDGGAGSTKIGTAWLADDWVPLSGPLDTLGPAVIRADDRRLAQRARRALQRRGCRTLMWVPLAVRGELVGAVELSDARARDFDLQLDEVAGLALICAQALDIDKTNRALEHRDRTMRELAGFSGEVAQTHDLERFAERFARHLMKSVSADRVDVYRVARGVGHLLLGVTVAGADRSRRGAVLDGTTRPSLEPTLTDLRPLAIDRLSHPNLSPAEVAEYREKGYASSLAMPLVSGGTLVGVVVLYGKAERDWGREVELLGDVLQVAAGLFDDAVLLDDVEEGWRLQSELVLLAAGLPATGSPEEIALQAAGRLREIVGCEHCDIWWLEEGYLRLLVSDSSQGADASAQGRTLQLDHFPSTRRSLDNRQALVFSTLSDPLITDREREQWRAGGFRSLLSLPLVADDNVVGLIDLFDTRERDYDEVRDFVVSAGHTIAGALRGAQLVGSLQQSNNALSALVELSDRLNEVDDLRELARLVADRLRTILQAEDCDIWGVGDGTMRRLASIDSRGWGDAEVGAERELSAHGISSAALAANEPLVIGDLDAVELPETEIAAYRAWGFRSMVSLPLVAEGRPIGLIDVFDTRVRDYTTLLDFIRSVGRLLASAFERALLVERLERGNRDLRLLVDSSLEFGATLDYDAVLRIIAQRVLETSGADFCDVYGVEGDEVEILVSVGGNWGAEPVGQRFNIRDYSLFAEALRTRRPVETADALRDPRMTEAERRDAAHWGYRATMDIPLIVHGAVIGLLELDNREPREFSRRHLLLGLAQIAAHAIANARMHRELNKSAHRAALLSESALELGSGLDLHSTLVAAARRLCDSVGVAECEITVLEGDQLTTVMRVASDQVDAEWIGRRISLADAAVSRQVIETKRPSVVKSLGDPRLTPRVHEINKEFPVMSWATLPLIVQDRVIGTVELVESTRERVFTQGELDTAAAICPAAAMAIENARLFASEQAANGQTLLLNAIAQRTAASLDLEEIVKAAADELRRLHPFDSHSLLLTDGSVIDRAISPDPQADALVGLRVDQVDPGFLERLRSQRVLRLRLPQDLPLTGFLFAGDMRSSAVIALPSENSLLGAFSLSSRAENAFDDVDVDLLERVGTQLALAIKNARLYDEIKQMHLGNLKALSSALNAKDYYTLGHAARVAAYTIMLGRRLGWQNDVLEPLQEAAYLHDIGKISISDRVLLKPGRLNAQEWEQMREHPIISAEIIRPLFSESLMKAVRHHHERYDGNGYPDRLAGSDIPPMARAMAVVDAYDAMSCRRPYKAALTYAECLLELRRCSGTQFDPAMVEAFAGVLEDLAAMRAQAEKVAALAAARIPGEKHALLRSRDDEDTSEYREIRETLREVRDAHPPTRFLTSHTRIDKKYVIGVDPEEQETTRSHFGDEIFADDELPLVLEGRRPLVNTVFADEFGVWISGLAPIHDADGKIVGAVSADLPALGGPESETVRGDNRQTFAAMLQTAAVRLSRAEIDAITDGLTGLYNHRYLHERLSEELHRTRELERPLSVLFCDIDHFKDYNDAHGHSAGDAVLREVAHVIEQSVRNVDIAGRYGGEEFVVLLVETDREAALAVAERIRQRVRAAGFVAAGRPLTVSIGVAGYPLDAELREELLDKADWAMYMAKRRGRDQVTPFSTTA